MKNILVEQFFCLINPVWDLLPVYTMADLVDFGRIHYLEISINHDVYTHTSLTVSSIIMSGWVGASKNNLASLVLQSTQKKNNWTSSMLGEYFHFIDKNKSAAR